MSPAYARLNQKLVREGLLGSEETISDGYVQRFKAGAIPKGGFKYDTNEEVFSRYLQDNPDVQRTITSGRDPDGSKAYWTEASKHGRPPETITRNLGKEKEGKFTKQDKFMMHKETK